MGRGSVQDKMRKEMTRAVDTVSECYEATYTMSSEQMVKSIATRLLDFAVVFLHAREKVVPKIRSGDGDLFSFPRNVQKISASLQAAGRTSEETKIWPIPWQQPSPGLILTAQRPR